MKTTDAIKDDIEKEWQKTCWRGKILLYLNQ